MHPRHWLGQPSFEDSQRDSARCSSELLGRGEKERLVRRKWESPGVAQLPVSLPLPNFWQEPCNSRSLLKSRNPGRTFGARNLQGPLLSVVEGERNCFPLAKQPIRVQEPNPSWHAFTQPDSTLQDEEPGGIFTGQAADTLGVM